MPEKKSDEERVDRASRETESDKLATPAAAPSPCNESSKGINSHVSGWFTRLGEVSLA